jgi:hypothetical protein
MTATAKGGGPKPGTRALPPQPAPAPPPAPLPEVPDGIPDFGSEVTEAEQRSALFKIDGTEYTIWDNPTASVGLRYLDVVRRRGGIAAAAWALEVMLGSEALAALKGCESLTSQQLQWVTEQCAEKLNATFGPEPPKAQD